MWLLNKISCEIQILNEKVWKLMIENEKLKEENELLNNELAWMKAHTRYNWITQEEYIDWTMSVIEAKLRMRRAKDKQNYISKLEEENKKLKDELYIWKLTARDYARLQWVNLPELSNI